MAGYTRQSVSQIINGADITAPPINAEFNALLAAFNAGTGHGHTGATGDAPQIPLTTSVSGHLPIIHGGIGGIHNLSATSAPTITSDDSQNYAKGSFWLNTATNKLYICTNATSNSAVWFEVKKETDTLNGNNLSFSAALDVGGYKIVNSATPTAATDVVIKSYSDAQDNLQVSKSGDTMSGPLAMGANKITGLAAPTAANDAVNKNYLDVTFGDTSAAATSATNAAASLATLQTIFVGAFATDPATAGLASGAVYYNNSTGLKVLNAGTWLNAVFDTAGALFNTNNLSDVTNAATSVANLGLAYNTIAVTASGGKFYLDGTEAQKASLSPSIQYRFDQSDSSNSNHPLKFSITADGTHDSGTEFTTGVTVVGTAGQAGAYVQITVQQDSPTLYYYCGNHSAMGSTAYKSGGSSSSSSGGTASAYVVPDASATDYMWKVIEIVPNNTTISGTWQGMASSATLYIGESDTIDSHYNYFETVATIDNHAAYQFIYVGDAATVTIPNGTVLHGFATAPVGGAAATDKYQSTGRVTFFGDN